MSKRNQASLSDAASRRELFLSAVSAMVRGADGVEQGRRFIDHAAAMTCGKPIDLERKAPEGGTP